MTRKLPNPATELCCPVCRVKVSRITSPAGRVWYDHAGRSDHEVGTPLRLPPADVIHVCDFCMRPHPVWMFPLRDHASTVSPVHPEIGYRVDAVDTDAWWGACQECADLVTGRKIGELRDRALDVMVTLIQARFDREPSQWERESTIMQLAAFWLSVPGDPVPFR